MTDLNTLIAMAKELNASDVHIVSGLPVRCRVDGSIRNLTEELLTFEDCENYGRAMAGPRFSEIEEMGELDLAQSFPCGARTRINLFRHQGSLSAAIRLLAERIPELEELDLPPVVASFPDYRSGIVLVTGPTGSGKSTLISHFNGLNRPTSGRILIDGKDMWEQGADLRAFRFQVGLVMQYPEYQLFEETCAKDIAYGPRNMGLDEAEIDRRVKDAAAFIGRSAAWRLRALWPCTPACWCWMNPPPVWTLRAATRF